MALKEKDSSVLKHNVLQLLLQHSQGVSFGNFTGAFYQLHGYHPHISLHGYRSLKHLVADMKNVVVEGDSHKAVMKIANGFHRDHLPEGGQMNGLDNSEREAQSLTDTEKASSGAGPCSPAVSLDTDFSACSSNTLPEGQTSGSCSPAVSLDGDFSPSNSDGVSQRLIAKKPDLAAALVPILDVLGGHPLGLNVKALQENLEKKHQFDLETLSQDLGYEDVVSCLLHMPGLRFSFVNGKWPHNCIVQLLSNSLSTTSELPSAGASSDEPLSSSGSNVSSHKLTNPPIASCSSASSQASTSSSSVSGQLASKSKKRKQNILGKKLVLSEVLAVVTSLLTTYKSGLRVKKLKEFLLAKERIDLEQFSIAQGHKDTLEFLERQMPMLNIRYQENRLNCVIFLGSGREDRNSKQPCTKVQKETSSKCPAVVSLPASSNAPVQFLGPSRKAESVNAAPGFREVPTASFTFDDISASKFPIPSCPVAVDLVSQPTESCLRISKDIESPVISNFPSLRESHAASADKNPSQSVSGIPPQWPSICRSGGLPPAKEAPSPSDARRPSEPSLTKPHPPKDLNELKWQVSRILAMHPKGMSLFQFRAAYSAIYQQHLPLGTASSAKHRLLEMPDVVCLKGYGVQTVLLPVSQQMSPAKSGQPASSKVENAAMLPGPSLPKTVSTTKSGTVLKHSSPTVPVVPRPRPVSAWASDQPREPGSEDGVLFHPRQSLRAPKIIAPRESHRRSGVDCSGQVDLPKEATVVPGHSLPDANPAEAPNSCLKHSHHNVPVPQPHLSLLQSSNCLEATIHEANHVLLQPQKAPKPITSVQKQLKTSSKPVPHSPVICPQDSQAAGWDESMKLLSIESQPGISGNGALASRSVSANPAICMHQLMHPPLMSFLEIPKIPPLHPASFPPVSENTSTIQFPKPVLQSSYCIQPVPSVELFQPISSIQVTNQRVYVHAAPVLDPFYQSQKPSRSLQSVQSPAHGLSARTPVSSPSKKSTAICLQKSQTVQPPECDNPMQLGDLQHSSASAPDKCSTFASLNRNPSELLPSSCKEQYDDVSSPLPRLSAQSFSVQSAPSKASPQPVNFPSTLNSSSNVQLLDHSVFISEQPCINGSTVASTKPVCSPHYPLGSTISPSCQLPCAPSGINNNSEDLPTAPSALAPQQQDTNGNNVVATLDTSLANALLSPPDTASSLSQEPLSTFGVCSDSDGLPSEPPALVHQQQCANSVSTAMDLTKPPYSATSLQDCVANPCDQPSSPSSSVDTDHDVPSQSNPVSVLSKPSDNSHASLPEKQVPYSAPESNPIHTSFDRCIIL
ncbi:nascent polypeptide-associated complex subunit alpha, muscle-specific form-like isoform X2 [Varanus komodoensis]|uniref:nascent polypeptide-associated complex subunit alpha, muscle-specific form-like isoform X2 n=1 Tax=Varanus komodoensis TaxID=61221 RepID=UPI001CF7D08B|nr:nascent polypeptide-associated complex subunit alpha, muscle-specific form-like isoform X2 [Varanus komodoensis]